MAQLLRTLTALPGVLSSNPSNHMVAHNHLWWDLMSSSGVSEESNSVLKIFKTYFQLPSENFFKSLVYGVCVSGFKKDLFISFI